jgi:periplasmic divalent cation tolerance protein
MRLVVSTCPIAEAPRLARALLEERLVACVNVVPAVQSVYWWEGKITEDVEALLLMKTRAERVEALLARLKALHPYQVAEILTFAVAEGNADYLDWVARETGGVAGSSGPDR